MRYFYIICLVLSSFFIYNHSSADNIERQYAFFIPGNAYQKNTTINNLDSINPRYKKNNTDAVSNQVSASQNQKSKIKTKPVEKLTRPITKHPLKEISESKPTATNTLQKTATLPKQNNMIKEETSALTADAPAFDEPASATSQQLTQKALDRIKEKASQYNLDEDDGFIILTTESTQHKEKDTKTMLSEIPFPNPDEPSFKQTFGKYGISLRTLYYQKSLPRDYEQERILSKANSIKRFKVEATD